MRIVTILGSHKKNGKTATALVLAEKKLKFQRHKITRINVAEYQINACRGCYTCMQSRDMPSCVIKDDMNNIFSEIISADAIILSSPVYFFGLTAQIKALVDRIFCLSNTSLLDEKYIAGLITCMGQEEGNTEPVKEFFSRTFDGACGGVFHTCLIGTYIISRSNSDYFTERTELITSELVKKLISSFDL